MYNNCVLCRNLIPHVIPWAERTEQSLLLSLFKQTDYIVKQIYTFTHHLECVMKCFNIASYITIVIASTRTRALYPSS